MCLRSVEVSVRAPGTVSSFGWVVKTFLPGLSQCVKDDTFVMVESPKKTKARYVEGGHPFLGTGNTDSV